MNEPTRDDKMSAAKARMAELARKFLDRTAQDLATMRSGVTRLTQADTGGIEDVRQLAHRMVGTGATLGFESISEKAYAVESITDSLTDGKRPDDTTCSELVAAMDALEAEFARVKAG